MLDITPLVERLTKLSPAHQVAFGAACTERLLPNYLAFFLMESWGDPMVLRVGLDLSWSYLKGVEIAYTELDQTRKRCLDITPDLDDFHSPFAAGAMRAAISTAYTLLSCLEQPPVIYWIVEESFESIRQYLARVADPTLAVHGHNQELEDWIDKSPLLQDELNRQFYMLLELEGQATLSIDIIANLQESSKVGGIQPVQRGLVGRHRR